MAEKQAKKSEKKNEKKDALQEKQEKRLQEKKAEREKLDKRSQLDEHETLVRILVYDIPGSKNLYTGLTRIKGVSWTISNAICISLGLDKMKKISELSKEEIGKIEHFLKNPSIPDFLKNRRLDEETGQTSHFIGTDLDFKKEFDIKKMKKIKSYKGIRHTMKLPVRGQRTRSHFRQRGKAVGVKKKAAKA